MPARNESKMCGEAPAPAVGEAEGGKPSEPEVFFLGWNREEGAGEDGCRRAAWVSYPGMTPSPQGRSYLSRRLWRDELDVQMVRSSHVAYHWASS